MIKAIIFDADGPLYHRTDKVLEQKKKLLGDFGYTGALESFEKAYDTEKFKAYVGVV